MIRAVVTGAIVLATSSAGVADRRSAYVDEVVVAGGPDAAQGRAFVAGILHRAGLEPRFAEADATPCADEPSCLVDRARALGAAIGVRATIAEVGDHVVASLIIADPRRTSLRREIAFGVDLDRPDAALALAVREAAGPEHRPRRRLAWVVAGASAGLAIGGGLSVLHARGLRSQFFRDHVDENGDVVGISPADAREAERTAQRWALLGGVLLAGAGAAAVGATVLFVTDRDGEVRPAGVALVGALP